MILIIMDSPTEDQEPQPLSSYSNYCFTCATPINDHTHHISHKIVSNSQFNAFCKSMSAHISMTRQSNALMKAAIKILPFCKKYLEKSAMSINSLKSSICEYLPQSPEDHENLMRLTSKVLYGQKMFSAKHNHLNRVKLNIFKEIDCVLVCSSVKAYFHSVALEKQEMIGSFLSNSSIIATNFHSAIRQAYKHSLCPMIQKLVIADKQVSKDESTQLLRILSPKALLSMGLIFIRKFRLRQPD